MATPRHVGDKISNRIRDRGHSLSPALVRVLDFIDTHRHEVMTMSAMELAQLIGTSDATVVRAVQAVGFQGLKELRHAISASLGMEQTPIDTITRTFELAKARSESVVDQVFAAHKETFAALENPEVRDRISAAIECLSSANRLGIFGGGAPALLGRYLALALSQIGRPTALFDGYMSPLPEQLLDMRNVDALLMLAFGRPHRGSIMTMSEAKQQRLPVVLITNSKENTLTRHANVVIPVVCSRAGGIIVHGATLVCLEAIIMGMVEDDPRKTMSSLERLGELRRSLHKP